MNKPDQNRPEKQSVQAERSPESSPPGFKITRFQKIAFIYLACLASYVWGLATIGQKVFPYGVVENIIGFVKGDRLENTTLTEKIVNDAGIYPARHLGRWRPTAIKHTRPVEVPGINPRRDKPQVYVDADHRTGYRAIFGALDFKDCFWGGVLLDGSGKVIHTWKLSTSHIQPKPMRDELLRLYGLCMLPDGSVIFCQQEDGGGIVKVNAGSEVVWNLEGAYHHTVSPTEDGCFWTFAGGQEEFDHKFAKVSCETGVIQTVIDMAEVRRKNPFLHIFNLQKEPTADDISHGNDIEELSSDLAPHFPGFKAGDLLLSYRTQNLLFVLDPATLKVKWWRVGASDRQHDADWEEDGTIAVFSNNQVCERRFTDIVAINPVTYEHKVIVDGTPLDFFSDINGLHQRTGFGTRIITSTTQGWVFELDEQNKLVFSFLNVYNKKEKRSLALSAAFHVPEDYLTKEFLKSCGQ